MSSIDTRFKPGVSGNPAGRKKGDTKIAWFNSIVGERKKELLEQAIKEALNGSEKMLDFILSRYCPAVAKDNHLDIDIDLNGTHTQQARQILEACNDNYITPLEAINMLTALQQGQKVFQEDEFVRRLEKVEEMHRNKSNDSVA